jgi:multiple sugar transport system permease protein
MSKEPAPGAANSQAVMDIAPAQRPTPRHSRECGNRRLRLVIVYLLLIVLGALFFAPFVWLVMTSFKPEREIFQTVWPHHWVWENYTKGLQQFPFWLFLRNTLFLCTVNVIGVVLSSSLVAYGLARIPWKGRNVLFAVLLSTMMLPAQVTMVPLFAVFKALGWIDTFLPLTVPAFLGNAFFVFLLRQFFLTIPADLTDAARLDGCAEFDIYRRVTMPLAKPALATVALFTFLNTWNDFLGPLIYLYDDRKFPLSLGLAMFTSQYGSFWGQLMAVSTLMTAPILVLFFFTQRTFIQGITMTGIKG